MSKKISEEIEKIKKRNLRVESDKSWETSWTRRIIIATATYFTIGVFLLYIKADNPLVVAFVPTIGYLLSTLTMPVFKIWWLRSVYKRNE